MFFPNSIGMVSGWRRFFWILDKSKLAKSDYVKLSTESDGMYRRLNPFVNELGAEERRLPDFN